MKNSRIQSACALLFWVATLTPAPFYAQQNKRSDFAQTKNNTVTYQLLLEHANKGDVQAQNQLGQYYEVKNQAPEALRWFKLAAEQGSSDAQFHLGTIFEEGRIGVHKDTASAISWYEEAARNGMPQAHKKLDSLVR